MRWIVVGIGAVLAALFVVLAVSKPDEGEANGPQLRNTPAPQMVTTTIDGAPWNLAEHRGRWVVLNFFQTSCIPCQAEHRELLSFSDQQRTLGANGAELVSVIDNETDAEVRAWFAQKGGTWPVLHDDDATIGVSFGVTGVPETYLVDPSGVVRVRWVGPTTNAALTEILRVFNGGSVGTTPGSATSGGSTPGTA